MQLAQMAPKMTEMATPVTWDDPFRALLVLVFISLLVERSLSVIYATRLWLRFREVLHSMGIQGTRLYVAIIVNVMLAFAVRLDAFYLLTGVEPTTIGMLLTGLCNAGGAKAWSDIYNQFNAVREGRVRETTAKAVIKEVEANGSRG